MGISLKDLGNFAVGAIERDRELTKEDLAIRAEALQANRNFLIKQKEKKYDQELKNYYDEKKKFDVINESNKLISEKAIDPKTYARRVLSITEPGWNDYTDDMKEEAVNQFDGKTFDYKLVGNEEEISKRAAEINNKIENETANAIKNAKGDSFLINKILNIKKKTEADLLKQVENKIKATEAIKLTEKNVNQEYVGIPVKVSSYSEDNPYFISSKEKTTNTYKKFYEVNINQAKALKDFNTKRTSADNNLVIAKSAKELGITNLNDYFKLNADKEIQSFKGSGESFANTQFSQNKMYKDFAINPGNDYLYIKLGKDATKLITYYDKENVNGVLANRTKDYAVPLSSGAILGKDGKLNFSTILRNEDNLIVIPTANTIDFDDSIKGTDKVLSQSEKDKAKVIYANVLKDISSANVNGKNEFNPQLLKSNQARLEDLQYNNNNNQLLADVNFRFNLGLLKENIITEEQFFQNKVNDYLYNAKDENGNSPYKNLYETVKPKTITSDEDNDLNKINFDKIDSKMLTVTFSDNKTKTLPNTPEVIKILKEDMANGNILDVKGQLKQTGGDGSVAEQTMGVNKNTTKKKTPADFGITNQPLFDTRESIEKVLNFPMTGKELQETFAISPGLNINPKSIYRPLK